MAAGMVYSIKKRRNQAKHFALDGLNIAYRPSINQANRNGNSKAAL